MLNKQTKCRVCKKGRVKKNTTPSKSHIAHRFFSEGVVKDVSFMRVDGRQEHVVEREVLWEITKLRVDRGCAIDLCEAAAERAGAEMVGWHS